MPTDKKVDYSALNDELESILNLLQDGDLDVDDAMAKYERGLALVGLLEKQLEQAQNKITKLKADSAA
jgi:exodeoxyribonuclease VII small subunit